MSQTLGQTLQPLSFQKYTIRKEVSEIFKHYIRFLKIYNKNEQFHIVFMTKNPAVYFYRSSNFGFYKMGESSNFGFFKMDETVHGRKKKE